MAVAPRFGLATARGLVMRARREDTVRSDLRDYGHAVNRRRALRELHPPLERVVQELEGWDIPGPSPLERAA